MSEERVNAILDDVKSHLSALNDCWQDLYKLNAIDRLSELLIGPIPKLSEQLWDGCQFYYGRWNLLKTLPKRGVVTEVGTHTGSWAREILDRAVPKKLTLIDINLKPLRRELIEKEVMAGIVEVREGVSWDVLAQYPDDHFDWIYIDAGHEYESVKRDTEIARKKVKKGGFIVFNDFTNWSLLEFMPYGIPRNVFELASEGNFTFTHFAFNDTGYHDVALRRDL